jgi:hypothetical protein
MHGKRVMMTKVILSIIIGILSIFLFTAYDQYNEKVLELELVISRKQGDYVVCGAELKEKVAEVEKLSETLKGIREQQKAEKKEEEWLKTIEYVDKALKGKR